MNKEPKTGMKTLFVQMLPDEHQRLKEIAFMRGLSMKDVVLEWIRTSPEPQIQRTPSGASQPSDTQAKSG